MTISKCLERKLELIPNGEKSQFTNPIELEYYLTESEGYDCEELEEKKVYGIEIVKTNGNKTEESKLIINFSCSKENTKRVLSRLIKNTVTPVSLPFILDDILGE